MLDARLQPSGMTEREAAARHSRSFPSVIPASFKRESRKKDPFLIFPTFMPRMTQHDREGRSAQSDFAEELLKQGVIRANAGDVLHGFPSSGVAVSQGFVVLLVGQERENRFEVIP